MELDLSKPHLQYSDIQQIIKLRPKNLDIYRQAFVHKSFSKVVGSHKFIEIPDYMKKDNERLEFIGDAVLNLVVGDVLYKNYPTKDEGFLTKLRTKIVRGSNCSSLAKKLNLDKYILCSNGVPNDHLLEDVFESLIGAIYLDLGFTHADFFIKKLIEDTINFDELISENDNYKDILMRYTQVNQFELPIYKIVKTPQENSKKFTISVSLKKISNTQSATEIVYGIGSGLTRKEAEQNACKDSICFSNIDHCKIHTCNDHKIHLNEISEIMKT